MLSVPLMAARDLRSVRRSVPCSYGTGSQLSSTHRHGHRRCNMDDICFSLQGLVEGSLSGDVLHGYELQVGQVRLDRLRRSDLCNGCFSTDGGTDSVAGLKGFYERSVANVAGAARQLEFRLEISLESLERRIERSINEGAMLKWHTRRSSPAMASRIIRTRHKHQFTNQEK
jgi:hypothetical protein